jgi:hypothetical protein
MPEKEIKILLPSPTILKVRVSRTTTVRQIEERLEELGLKGYVLAAEPSDFLYFSNERLFNKISEGEIVYAFCGGEESFEQDTDRMD